MKNLIRSIFYLGILLILVAAGFGFFSIFHLSKELPRLPQSLEEINLHVPTEIYDDNKEILFVLGGVNRVPLESVSSHFKKAILAAEDKNFYFHHGVDKTALMRALLSNLQKRKATQGASTITQQLTKNLFFSFKKSYKRKLSELLIALQFETAFSKDEILEAYCNQIYFGAGAYGIEDAARTYFGKHAHDLTLPEATLLAGLPNSPSRYNPYKNFTLAKNRQAYVLDRMAANGIISAEEKELVFETEIKLADRESRTKQVGYFVQHILKQCVAEFGSEAVNYGGLKIYTTFNRELQSLALNAMNSFLPEIDKLLVDGSGDAGVEGALVAIEPGTGWVKAMVGGRNYSESQYNRAVANNRQPGSSFKPFVYYTAFDQLGYLPNTVVVDEPFTVDIKGSTPWEPKNYGGRYHGPVILKQALMKSINVVSAKLIAETGAENVIATAKKFGITSPLPAHLSIALGSCSVSPLEMASAFSVVATGGKYAEPAMIKRIVDNRGNIVKENIAVQRQVLDPQKNYMLLDMMKGVFRGGTASGAYNMGWKRPSIGKTGTTNDSRDSWFTGFTPTLGASVWVGYDDNRPMVMKNNKGLTGARGALPIWVNFMQNALEGEPVSDFPVAEDIEFVSVDASTGKYPDAFTEKKMEIALRVKEAEELFLSKDMNKAPPYSQ